MFLDNLLYKECNLLNQFNVIFGNHKEQLNLLNESCNLLIPMTE